MGESHLMRTPAPNAELKTRQAGKEKTFLFQTVWVSNDHRSRLLLLARMAAATPTNPTNLPEINGRALLGLHPIAV